MRLYNYLNISDPSTSLFRSLNINLVEKTTNNVDIVKDLERVDGSIENLLKEANRELKSVYRGKMVFDLCTEEEGYTPDEVKMTESKKDQVKQLWFKLNDDLSNIQSEFESYISSLK